MRSIKLESILFTAFYLSGCAIFCGEQTPPGCKPMVNASSGKLEVSGIEIPVGTKDVWKIGNGSYTPAQVQILSESATRMEQYRMGQCNILSTLIQLKPQPADKIADIAKQIASLNLDLQKLFLSIPLTEDAQKTTEEIKNKVDKSINKEEKSAPPQSSSDIENKILARINELEIKLSPPSSGPETKVVNNTYTTQSNSRHIELSIPGFAIGKVDLSARMKAHLLADLRSAINSSTKAESVTIDIIGYADPTGNGPKNILLALSRAKATATYITSSEVLERGHIRLVASGGISDGDEVARQVKIFIYQT